MENSSRISAADLKRWGASVIENKDPTFEDTGLYHIVQLPENTEITDKDGKVVARATKEQNIGFCNVMTGEIGVGKAEDFYMEGKSKLPTLDNVNEWNEREKGLSEFKRAMIFSYIDRTLYDEKRFSPEVQKLRRDNLFNYLLKHEDSLLKIYYDEMKFRWAKAQNAANISKLSRVAEPAHTARAKDYHRSVSDGRTAQVVRAIGPKQEKFSPAKRSNSGRRQPSRYTR